MALADTTTWGEMAKRRKELKIPEGTPPGHAFVQILDPATGTGTFLVEVIDLMHRTMTQKWKSQGHDEQEIQTLWNEYVPTHLLPRLHGYELLMAPYAIAHLKIGLKLYETGYRFESDERARVYLTNALEPPGEGQLTLDFLPALAHEAQAVNEIKRQQRFTVVIGNPPYSGVSSNMGPWIDGLLKGRLPDGTGDGELLPRRRRAARRTQGVAPGRLREVHPPLAVAARRHGCGHSRLHQQPRLPRQPHVSRDALVPHAVLPPDPCARPSREPQEEGSSAGGRPRCQRVRHPAGRSHRAFHEGCRSQQMCLPRRSLGRTGAEVPLAIGARLRRHRMGTVGAKPAVSPVRALRRRRNGRLLRLAGNQRSDDRQRDRNRHGARCFRHRFRPGGPPRPGSPTCARSRCLMMQSGRSTSSGRVRRSIRPGDSRGWKLPAARRKIREDDQWDERCAPVLYRPFDVRKMYYVPWMVDWPRTEAMPHMLAGENVGFITTRQTKDEWGALATSNIIAHKTCSAYDINSLFPLYLYSGVGKADGSLFTRWAKGKDGRTPNLDLRFVEQIAAATELRFVSDGRGDLQKTFGPEDVLAGIYAVFHSPSYRERYEAPLKLDFPRVPLPGSAELFRKLAEAGHELLVLHVLESLKLRKPITSYAGPRIPEVGRVGWSDDTVWLDAGKTNAREGHRATKPGTIGFKGVPEEVWDFHIGGYQVCHKWLKDRKGRTLSDEDIAHYQKIVVALHETSRIMAEIDEDIEAHGGWPSAFLPG